MHTDHELLTVKEAAIELRCSRTKVFGLVRDGRLASVRFGRPRLIPRTALQAFIAAEQARTAHAEES